MTIDETTGADSASVSTAELERLRRDVARLNDCLRRKNLALDALHYVWCDGGCEGGTHRWTEKTVTEEVVAEAERNTTRLRKWWECRKGKIARSNAGAQATARGE